MKKLIFTLLTIMGFSSTILAQQSIETTLIEKQKVTEGNIELNIYKVRENISGLIIESSPTHSEFNLGEIISCFVEEENQVFKVTRFPGDGRFMAFRVTRFPGDGRFMSCLKK